MKVIGQIDLQTRCEHYNSEIDIIAIQFKCCNEFYSCIHCHEESSGHPVQKWHKTEFNQQAILCGACNHSLSIQQYFDCGNQCPHCNALFNPGCSNHYHFYFEQ